MNKAELTEITAKAKEKAVFEGTAQAFNDWLYSSDRDTCECFTNGVRIAFADWLKETKMEIMEMVKEIVEEKLNK